jgi:hypothetical protein
MPTQRSIACQFWSSPGILGLSMHATLFAAYVKSAPQSNFIGLYVLNFEDACRYTKARRRSQILQAIKECSQPQAHDGEPYLKYDSESQVIWLVKAIEWEFPTGKLSALQRDGIRRMIELLPRTWIVLECCQRYQYIGEPFQSLSQALANVVSDPHDNGDANGVGNPVGNGDTKPHLDGSESGSRLSALSSQLSASGSLLSASHGVTQPHALSAAAKALLDFWSDLYLERNGQRPAVEGKRDMECAKALLSGRTLEQAQEIVRFHFDSPSDFYRDHNLYGLHHIRKDCNQILARMVRPGQVKSSDLPPNTVRNLKASEQFLAMKPGQKPW